MDEKAKNKDADPATEVPASDLEVGLEDTFPASDPVSATREPEAEKSKGSKR